MAVDEGGGGPGGSVQGTFIIEAEVVVNDASLEAAAEKIANAASADGGDTASTFGSTKTRSTKSRADADVAKLAKDVAADEFTIKINTAGIWDAVQKALLDKPFRITIEGGVSGSRPGGNEHQARLAQQEQAIRSAPVSRGEGPDGLRASLDAFNQPITRIHDLIFAAEQRQGRPFGHGGPTLLDKMSDIADVFDPGRRKGTDKLIKLSEPGPGEPAFKQVVGGLLSAKELKEKRGYSDEEAGQIEEVARSFHKQAAGTTSADTMFSRLYTERRNNPYAAVEEAHQAKAEDEVQRLHAPVFQGAPSEEQRARENRDRAEARRGITTDGRGREWHEDGAIAGSTSGDDQGPSEGKRGAQEQVAADRAEEAALNLSEREKAELGLIPRPLGHSWPTEMQSLPRGYPAPVHTGRIPDAEELQAMEEEYDRLLKVASDLERAAPVIREHDEAKPLTAAPGTRRGTKSQAAGTRVDRPLEEREKLSAAFAAVELAGREIEYADRAMNRRAGGEAPGLGMSAEGAPAPRAKGPNTHIDVSRDRTMVEDEDEKFTYETTERGGGPYDARIDGKLVGPHRQRPNNPAEPFVGPMNTVDRVHGENQPSRTADKAARDMQIHNDWLISRGLRPDAGEIRFGNAKVDLEDIARRAEMGEFEDVFQHRTFAPPALEGTYLRDTGSHKKGDPKYARRSGVRTEYVKQIADSEASFQRLQEIRAEKNPKAHRFAGQEGTFTRVAPTESMFQEVLKGLGLAGDNPSDRDRASIELVREKFDTKKDITSLAVARGRNPLGQQRGIKVGGEGHTDMGATLRLAGEMRLYTEQMIPRFEGYIASLEERIAETDKNGEPVLSQAKRDELTGWLEVDVPPTPELPEGRLSHRTVLSNLQAGHALAIEMQKEQTGNLSPREAKQLAAARKARDEDATKRGLLRVNSREIVELGIGGSGSTNPNTGFYGDVNKGRQGAARVAAGEQVAAHTEDKSGFLDVFEERYKATPERPIMEGGHRTTNQGVMRQIAYGVTGRPQENPTIQNPGGLYGELLGSISPDATRRERKDAKNDYKFQLNGAILDQIAKEREAEQTDTDATRGDRRKPAATARRETVSSAIRTDEYDELLGLIQQAHGVGEVPKPAIASIDEQVTGEGLALGNPKGKGSPLGTRGQLISQFDYLRSFVGTRKKKPKGWFNPDLPDPKLSFGDDSSLEIMGLGSDEKPNRVQDRRGSESSGGTGTGRAGQPRDPTAPSSFISMSPQQMVDAIDARNALRIAEDKKKDEAAAQSQIKWAGRQPTLQAEERDQGTPLSPLTQAAYDESVNASRQRYIDAGAAQPEPGETGVQAFYRRHASAAPRTEDTGTRLGNEGVAGEAREAGRRALGADPGIGTGAVPVLVMNWPAALLAGAAVASAAGGGGGGKPPTDEAAPAGDEQPEEAAPKPPVVHKGGFRRKNLRDRSDGTEVNADRILAYEPDQDVSDPSGFLGPRNKGKLDLHGGLSAYHAEATPPATPDEVKGLRQADIRESSDVRGADDEWAKLEAKIGKIFDDAGARSQKKIDKEVDYDDNAAGNYKKYRASEDLKYANLMDKADARTAGKEAKEQKAAEQQERVWDAARIRSVKAYERDQARSGMTRHGIIGTPSDARVEEAASRLGVNLNLEDEASISSRLTSSPDSRVLKARAARLKASRSLPQRALSTSLVQIAQNAFGGVEGPQQRLIELGNRTSDVEQTGYRLQENRAERERLVEKRTKLRAGMQEARTAVDPATGLPRFANRAAAEANPDYQLNKKKYDDLGRSLGFLSEKSRLLSKSLAVGADDVARMAKNAVGFGDIIRNLGAGFVGGIAGGLVTGALSQVVGSVTEVGALGLDRAMGNVNEISAQRKAIGQQTQASAGRGDVAVANVAAASGMSDAMYASLSKDLVGAGQMEAGNNAINAQLDLARLAEDTRKRGAAAGVSTTLGGAFGSFLGGTAPLSETMAAYLGESGARREDIVPPPVSAPLELYGEISGDSSGDSVPLDEYGHPPGGILSEPRPVTRHSGGVPVADNGATKVREEAIAKLAIRLGVLNQIVDKSGKAMIQFTDGAAFSEDELRAYAKTIKDITPQFADMVDQGRMAIVNKQDPTKLADPIQVAMDLQAAGLEAPKPSVKALLDTNKVPISNQLWAQNQMQVNQAENINPQTTAMGNVMEGFGTLGGPGGPSATSGTNFSDQPRSVQKKYNAELGITQELYDDINKSTDEGIVAARAFVDEFNPEQAVAFGDALGNVMKMGKDIANIKIGVETQNAALAADQYANSIFIAKRSLKDALGLVGKAGGSNNLGAIERQQFMLQRESQGLGLGLSQRQINFQRAQASFQAPGDTSEERAARKEQAKIEADYAQKQLDIQKKLFGLGKRSFDISGARQVRDLNKQVDLLERGRSVALDTIVAEKKIAVLSKAMAAENKRVETFYNTAVQRSTDVIGLTQQIANAAGKAMREVGSVMLTEIDKYFDGLIKAANDAAAGVTDSGYNRGDPSTRTHNAGGFVGTVSGTTSLGPVGVAGESAGEAVAILKDPKKLISPMGGMGGGGDTYNETVIINNPVIRNDQDITALTVQVEKALNRRAALIGMRSLR